MTIYIRPDSLHSLKIGVAKDEVTDDNIEAVEIIELLLHKIIQKSLQVVYDLFSITCMNS